MLCLFIQTPTQSTQTPKTSDSLFDQSIVFMKENQTLATDNSRLEDELTRLKNQQHMHPMSSITMETKKRRIHSDSFEPLSSAEQQVCIIIVMQC